MAETKTVLFLSNHFITLYNFRRELVARLLERGHRVVLSMPAMEQNVYFKDLGCEIIETPMSRRGMDPLEDLRLLRQYRRIMRAVDPDVIFSYTIKPNIYGTLASNALGYRQICNITGTGATFLKDELEGWDCTTDAGVVSDDSVLDWHVEIYAHDCLFAGKVVLIDCHSCLLFSCFGVIVYYYCNVVMTLYRYLVIMPSLLVLLVLVGEVAFLHVFHIVSDGIGHDGVEVGIAA